MDRVIALIDMDCFYVQVEQRDNPDLKGKPCAVVQYNTWKGGAIIAVGYEARACGVTRQMRGEDARKNCPEIKLVHVPTVREKANLTKYRDAGAEVIQVFMTFTDRVERASVDEAYIDLTTLVADRMKMLNTAPLHPDQMPNTYVIGHGPDDGRVDKEKAADAVSRTEGVARWLSQLACDTDVGDDDAFDETNVTEQDGVKYHDQCLAVGAGIVEEMRAAVYDQTGFRCSAGIAHNKVLAKLAAGIHKPNGQSVLPHSCVNGLFTRTPIKKVRNFGGKFGENVIEQLQVEKMADICQFSMKNLQEKFGEKCGSWLFEMCRGFEHEPISMRQFVQSVGCGKNFLGKEMLDTKEKVKHWLKQLSAEVEERLVKDREMNNRVAKHLTVFLSSTETRGSRSCGITRYDAEKFANDAFLLLSKFNRSQNQEMLWSPPVTNLSMCAGKFAPVDESATTMHSFFTTEPSQISQLSTQVSCHVSPALTAGVTPAKPPTCDKARKRLIQGLFQKIAASQSVDSESRTLDSDVNREKHQWQNASPSMTMETGSKSLGKKSFLENFMQSRANAIPVVNDTCDTSQTESMSALPPVGGHSVSTSEVPKSVPEMLPNEQDGDTTLEHTADQYAGGVAAPSASDDYVLCDKCNKQILVWDLEEHTDFHFALELQDTPTVPQLPLGGTINPLSDMSGASGHTSAKRKFVGDRQNTVRPTKRVSLQAGSKTSYKLDRFFSKS